MSDEVVTDASPLTGKNSCVYHWIPIMDLEPGRVLARPVLVGSGAHPAFYLAPGNAIAASTIAQLINKGVDCVAVLREPPPDLTIYAEQVTQYESRLAEIFGEHPDENCQALLSALLADGPR